MTEWQPPRIVQPTFGHPYCDRCGAVIVEEAKGRHVEEHRKHWENNVTLVACISAAATEPDAVENPDEFVARIDKLKAQLMERLTP